MTRRLTGSSSGRSWTRSQVLSATSRAVSAVACAHSMSTSVSSKAASCSEGLPGSMRGSGAVVASFHICVAMTSRLRSSIWSTAGRLPACAAPGGETLEHGERVVRCPGRPAAVADLEVKVVAPARPGAAHTSHVLTHAHLVTGLKRSRAKHVEVHEGVPHLGAPDGDVVAAPAVVAGLHDPAVADRHERRAGRREHVLPLMHVAAPRGAEASVGLAPVHVAAHGEDR